MLFVRMPDASGVQQRKRSVGNVKQRPAQARRQFRTAHAMSAVDGFIHPLGIVK